MPTARRSRTIAAPVQELWELVRDPHHLPRWWPRVTRVENVTDGAFTEVMTTKKGKLVRADFNLVRSEDAMHALRWEQRVAGTPFARVLASAETAVRLEPVDADTRVTLELHQKLHGFFPRFGGAHMLRRAARATLDEALDGLERISV
jgi:carbon monoxide dehydrogenase subunit G